MMSSAAGSAGGARRYLCVLVLVTLRVRGLIFCSPAEKAALFGTFDVFLADIMQHKVCFLSTGKGTEVM